jgi:predicted nucleotidyltransferase
MVYELGKIFGSRLRANALGWLFSHPDESFYVRQLATRLKEDPTNLGRELLRLETTGIVSSTKRGNQKYFQVNRQCPFYYELMGLVRKTVGVIGVVKAALEEIPGIQIAFLYGSFAKGEERRDSDVDLMIVGNVALDLLDPALANVEDRLGRTVNYAVYDEEEFTLKRKKRNGFIRDVLNGPKVILVGDEDDITNT